jgi:glycosyltransferase involved in cell wall biosynthesis
MRIGYFTTLFPYPKSFTDPEQYNLYPVGGAENWAYHLAHQMAKLGHDVVVFTTSVDSKNHLEKEDGIKVYRYGTNIKIEKARFSVDLLFKPLQHDIDIAHLHFSLPPGNLAGILYAWMKRKPLGVTYHGDAMPGYGKLIRRIGLGLQDKFIVPAILSRARLITSYSIDYISVSHILPKYSEKIIAVPAGINADNFRVPYSREECREKLSLNKDEKIILFVGALINYKSPGLLIQAMPAIIKKEPDAKLVLVGDGPLRGELETLANNLHLSHAVNFVGAIPYNVTPLYYNSSDIFVLPSTGNTESFGIVLLEAASAGLPIVVSSLDTFRSFIRDGYNGMIAKLGDIDSLAETINRLLSDPALRQEIGENARVSVREYSWENIATMMDKLYGKIAKT